MNCPAVERKGRLLAAGSPAVGLLGWAAIASAIALAVCLAWRTFSTNDLGYHLAYGDHWLDTGSLIDSDEFIYTEPDPADLGPGCWYDAAAGRYHFPNANYASQIVMSLVHRTWGVTGLSVLQAALIGLLAAITAATMLRLGIQAAWAGAGLLLVAMTAYERFNLRPEVFGYVFLAAELCILASRRPGWLAAGALVLIQWAFVQFHSYWMLGAALTFCFFAEAAGRAVWTKAVCKKAVEHADGARLRCLTVALAGQLAVAFVNPWTWRLASLPVETLLFMRAHDIAGGSTAAGGHSWSYISEFFRPFSEHFLRMRPTYAFVAVLALTGLGALAAGAMRRWAHVLVLAGVTAVSLQMRRNIAPAAAVLVPVALAGVAGAASWLAARCRGDAPKRSWPAVPAAAVTICLSAWWIVGVVTNSFYYTERRNWRFGAGLSALHVPLAASKTLEDLPEDVRVFTSVNVSSNVLYFSRSDGTYREVPVLTNTWASPPATMMEIIDLCAAHRPFAPFAVRYNVLAVVLDVGKSTAPLATRLFADPTWKGTYADAKHVVFMRADLPVDAEAFRDTGKYIADVKKSDPRPASALHTAARSLYYLTLLDQAIEVCEECLRADEEYRESWYLKGVCLKLRQVSSVLGDVLQLLAEDEYHEAWYLKGVCLRLRGGYRLRAGDPGGRKDLQDARDSLTRALEIREDYEAAKQELALVNRQITALPQGTPLPLR